MSITDSASLWSRGDLASPLRNILMSADALDLRVSGLLLLIVSRLNIVCLGLSLLQECAHVVTVLNSRLFMLG